MKRSGGERDDEDGGHETHVDKEGVFLSFQFLSSVSCCDHTHTHTLMECRHVVPFQFLECVRTETSGLLNELTVRSSWICFVQQT